MSDSRIVWESRIDALISTIRETHMLIEVIGKERLQDVQVVFPESDKDANKLGTFNDADQAYELMLLVLQIGISVQLLKSLEAFVSEASEFFLNKFFGKGAGDTLLDENDAFRHRFIMRVLLYQAALDLNIIQQAVNQRRSIADMQKESAALKLSLQNKSVNMADSVATMALDPLIHAGYLPQTTNVICYLDKNVRARLVPYDDTVLIRIASDAIQLNTYTSALAGDDHTHILRRSSLTGGPSRDLLALLHEIGHHLFWNGRFPQTNTLIYQELMQKAKDVGIYHPREWRRRWMEEIFADAFAITLGGPAVVLDFQDMLSDDLPNHFKEDTDKHPIPELRPLIQTQILRKLTDENGQPLFTQMPDRLDEQWYKLIETKPLKQEYRIRSRKPAAGKDILQALDGLLDVIVELLQPLYPSIMQSTYFRQKGVWSKDHLDGHFTSLYTQFSRAASIENINKKAFLDIVEEILNVDDPTAIQDPAIRFYANKFSSTPKTFVQRVEELTGTTPATAPNDDWIDTFLSQGWSTEGPEGSVGGK